MNDYSDENNNSRKLMEDYSDENNNSSIGTDTYLKQQV